MATPAPHELAATLARQHPGLELLLLFGSRARGDHRPDSDWDLAFLAREGFDLEGARATAATLLRTDRVDLVDLAHASGLLRHRAARDGVCLFDAGGRDLEFRTRASLFWCEVEPVLRRAYGDVLARIRQ